MRGPVEWDDDHPNWRGERPSCAEVRERENNRLHAENLRLRARLAAVMGVVEAAREECREHVCGCKMMTHAEMCCCKLCSAIRALNHLCPTCRGESAEEGVNCPTCNGTGRRQ